WGASTPSWGSNWGSSQTSTWGQSSTWGQPSTSGQKSPTGWKTTQASSAAQNSSSPKQTSAVSSPRQRIVKATGSGVLENIFNQVKDTVFTPSSHPALNIWG